MTVLRDELQRTLGTSYTIERELGGGGMSSVFVARDNALGRSVVVKVLPYELAATVSVPEAALDKHYSPEFRQHQIRSARERRVMQPESETGRVQRGPDPEFGFRIASAWNYPPIRSPASGNTVSLVLSARRRKPRGNLRKR